MKKNLSLSLVALIAISASAILSTPQAFADTTQWSCTFTPSGSTHADGPDYLAKHVEIEIRGLSLTLTSGRKTMTAHASNSNPYAFFVERAHNGIFDMDEVNTAVVNVAARMIRQHDDWNRSAAQSITFGIKPTDDAGSSSVFVCESQN